MKGEEPPEIKHLNPLLVYFPDYGILVCKSCEFAIQPNAIDAHLLRHHIYREKRQHLLETTRKLRLLQPHDVRQPAGVPPAFPHLSVTAGYRCLIEGCEHLCASAKRMSQHLREQHGPVSVYAAINSSVAVRLQTFFRGNQIRYFQVTDGAEPTSPAHRTRLRYESLLPNRGDEPLSPERPPLTKPVMQDLMYLHHYVTFAGLAMARGPEPASFWTHDLPRYAGEHTFLMHGMLGVAAYQQALNDANPQTRRLHKEACLSHQSAGLALFRTLVSKPAMGTHMPLMAFARLLGTQNGVNYSLEGGLEPDADSSHSSPDLSPLIEFMNMINGGVNLLLDLQHMLPPESVLRAPTEVLQGLADLEIPLDSISVSVTSLINEFCSQLKASTLLTQNDQSIIPQDCSDVRQLVTLCLEALDFASSTQITAEWVADRISSIKLCVRSARDIARGLQMLRAAAIKPPSSTLSTPCPVLLCYPNIPPAIYGRISSLPSLLEAQLPMLADTDLRAFDQAMAILTSCYARSFAADTTWARWNGIESWPNLLPRHFHDMIESREPWALVLVAHWCVLIARQEPGYWHLRGQSGRLLKNVLANMDPLGKDIVRSCIEPLLNLC